MVNGHIPEREHHFAANTETLLLSKQGMFMCPIVGENSQVRSHRYIRPVRPLPEEPDLVMQSQFNQVCCLGGYVNADPLPTQLLRSNAGGSTAAEGVQDEVARIT